MDRLSLTTLFDNRIKHQLKGKVKNTIIDFLLNHERKQGCITNIQEQVRIAELDPRVDFQRSQLIELVEAVADMFAKNAITAKEHQLTTAAEARRMQEEADKLAEFKAEIEQDERDFEKSLTTTTVFMNE